MSKDKAPAARNPDGTFPKGTSGNPAGRPKGTKNKITLLRQSLELQLREQAAPDIGAVMEKAIEMATEGHPGMIKLLLELHMAKQAPEAEKASEKVEINIKAPKTEVIPTTIIDVTPTTEETTDGKDEESVQ